MKVLHVNSYYVTNEMYSQLYDRQVNAGLDITVYLPAPRGEEVVRPYGVVSYNHGKYDRIFFHLKHLKIWADAKKRFKGEHFDLVHAHSLFSNGYIAMRLKKEYGFPYIVAVRSTDLNTFFKWMPHLRGMGRKILKMADRVVFLSNVYKEETIEKYVTGAMKEELEKKGVVIPNGIDDFWLENSFTGLKSAPKRKLRIVTAARINHNKNQVTVCRAMEELIARGYDVSYTMVGQVQTKRIYREIMSRPFVKHVKFKKKEELKALYREMDIFVMPSHVETFGLAYAEAMSQGLPVIYTKGQGFDGRFMEGEAGYSVEAADVGGIVDAVLRICDNYEAISARCPSLAATFNWDVMVKEYDALMRTCMQELDQQYGIQQDR